MIHRYFLLGIVALVIIGVLGGFLQNIVPTNNDVQVGFASAGRTSSLAESSGFLQAFLPGSNCYSYYGADKGDCWSESESYTYGSATARASARMSVLNPFATTAGISYRTPDYTYNGKSVYVGNMNIQWACTPGDKAYIRSYDDLGWYTCNENGCSGTAESSWQGTYTITAPRDHLPQLRFQCWDYNRADSNGYWSYAWVWAGIIYYKNNNVQLVTSIPDSDNDGVKDNVDKCPNSQLPVDLNGCYKPGVTLTPSPNTTQSGNSTTYPENPVNMTGNFLDAIWRFIIDLVRSVLAIFGGSI